MPNGAAPSPALDAYKLEYQLAADRYENIYKALWQIFSYLSVVTGGLLTFGGEHLQQNLVWALASVPLLFWYFSTYLPLDRYGNLCLGRLAGIETDINGLSGSTIKHYTIFKESRPTGFFSTMRRARFAVSLFAVVLGLVFVWNGYRVLQILCRHEPLVYPKSGETKPISLTIDELKKLMQQSPPAGQAQQEAKPAKSTSQTPAVPPKGAPTKRKTN